MEESLRRGKVKKRPRSMSTQGRENDKKEEKSLELAKTKDLPSQKRFEFLFMSKFRFVHRQQTTGKANT